MKLNLKKQELVTLSKDAQVLAEELTPQVAGGTWTNPCFTMTDLECGKTGCIDFCEMY